MSLSARFGALLMAVAACTAPISPPPVAAQAQLVGIGAEIIKRGEAGDTIYLDLDPIMRTASWLWDSVPDDEYIGCVQGVMVGDTVHAVAIEMADMVQSDSVSAAGYCRNTEGFIGRLHPHKNLICWQSSADAFTFESAPQAAWDFISCGREMVWVSYRKVPNTRFLYLDKADSIR